MAEVNEVPTVGTVIITRRYDVTCPKCQATTTGEVGRCQGYEEVFFRLKKDGWKERKSTNTWICPDCKRACYAKRKK